MEWGSGFLMTVGLVGRVVFSIIIFGFFLFGFSFSPFVSHSKIDLCSSPSGGSDILDANRC